LLRTVVRVLDAEAATSTTRKEQQQEDKAGKKRIVNVSAQYLAYVGINNDMDKTN